MNEMELAQTYYAFRERYRDRDDRMTIMDAIVAGDWSVVDPDNEKIVARSPNLIQVALEDTAESASTMPTTRVVPHKNTASYKKKAGKMEKISTGYFDFSQMDLLIPQTVMDMAAFGFGVWVIWPDYDERLPFIERRDPRYCYPEPGFRPGNEVRRCMFSRQVHYSQMPHEYQAKVVDFVTDVTGNFMAERLKFALVEFFTETETTIAAMFSTTSDSYASGVEGAANYTPIILEVIENRTGVCPVVVGSRFTLDGQFRGQFDQIVGVLEAHVRLMGLIMDYADQCLAPDTPVLTEDLEWVPVGSLKVGQKIVAFDEEPDSYGRRWRTAEVTSAGRASLPSYRVTLADGTKFVASEGHRWLIRNAAHRSMWVTTTELVAKMKTQYKPKVVKLIDTWEKAESYQAGYLAGMFDGEGWVTSNAAQDISDGRGIGLRLGIAQRDNAALDLVEVYLDEYGFDTTRTSGSGTHHDVFNVHIGGGRREVVRLLGEFRPQRLLNNFKTLGGAETLGRLKDLDLVEVAEIEFIGDQEVVTLGTSTGTLVANGFAHHNSVYSDIWVKDLIGELSWGGGAYIELGPQGAIGRVPPAVTSLNVGQDLDRLVDAIHLGGRWPKSRPGQVDQSIASAKFVEAVAGVMNTAIKTYHQILSRMMEHAIRVCFITDQKVFPGDKAVSGILRNQEFVEEYNATTDIDLKNRIRVEYGLGLGKDPSQSAVLMLQYADKGYISNEYVQENIDGLTDVARERVRADVEKFQAMILSDLLAGLQGGTIPRKALADIMDARSKGEDLVDLYRKYIVEAQPQAPAAPGGAPPGPGGPPAGPGGLPAPGQPLDGGPPAVPPAPDPLSMMSRLSSQAGPTRASFLSVGAGR